MVINTLSIATTANRQITRQLKLTCGHKAEWWKPIEEGLPSTVWCRPCKARKRIT